MPNSSLRMRIPRLLPAVLPALALALAAVGCGEDPGTQAGDGPPAAERVTMACTTSPRDCGLLDHLLPALEADTGVTVDAVAVGTGKALEIARRGDADLVLVHAPELEREFVADDHGIERRFVMRSRFVIAGPADDPHGTADAPDAAAAVRRLAEAGARWVSRGDASGTHRRELALLEAAGVEPGWDGYEETGRGMAFTINTAYELRAHVLTDTAVLRAWLANNPDADPPGDLVPLATGPRLDNPYHVILVNPAQHPHVHVEAARRVAAWLTDGPGRDRIASFEIGGERVFDVEPPPGD